MIDKIKGSGALLGDGDPDSIQGCVVGGRTMTNDNKKQTFNINNDSNNINIFLNNVSSTKNSNHNFISKSNTIDILKKSSNKKLDGEIYYYNNIPNEIKEYFNNDKKKILKGVNQIYTSYITPEVVKKIDSSKLNPNIRDELEKQIEFLQNSSKIV